MNTSNLVGPPEVRRLTKTEALLQLGKKLREEGKVDEGPPTKVPRTNGGFSK